jgi:hypothetical protein
MGLFEAVMACEPVPARNARRFAASLVHGWSRCPHRVAGAGGVTFRPRRHFGLRNAGEW